MAAARLKSTGRFRVPMPAQATEISITSVSTLAQVLDREQPVATPIRPQGAATSSTDCNRSVAGTVALMSGLDRIINIDSYNNTVTAEAGVRLYALSEALADHGLELIGNHEMTGRTLGGAIAAPCMGPSIGNTYGSLGSTVTSLKMVTGAGKAVRIGESKKNFLGAIRSSYGMLGIVTEATLKVQPLTAFTATHRKLTLENFCSIVDTLSNSGAGFRFALLPYRDRVYLDLRRYANNPGQTYRMPWRIKDWGESTVLPNVCKSLSRLLPVQSVRYRIIDSVSEATQGLVNSRFLRTGNNATVQGRTASSIRKLSYSTWCFPATDFSFVARAYRDFCRENYERTGYRCDVPAIGYRICRDTSSLLSPSFDEPMIALQTASTEHKGWENFVIDLADFAEHWAGVPIFSQSRALRAEYAGQVYANRLNEFRKLRRQLDPENRLLTPFLAQYFQ
jgi:hypothetical protein